MTQVVELVKMRSERCRMCQKLPDIFLLARDGAHSPSLKVCLVAIPIYLVTTDLTVNFNTSQPR